ncbi:hypothetical protein HDU85_002489 [Gaertneriomyces sp. JEL0708]|nr:hypothetical protein HDU85_002489 [Gaertneriomyces sp. JEL0708]
MKTFQFGPWPIHASEVFFTSRLSLGLVNYKPIVPGHLLVIPRRVVARYQDLTPEEISDMFLSAQKIGKVAEKQYDGEALTMSIQDGPAAGQTVAHVHIHIIPRKKGDWANNDDIYTAIDESEKDMSQQFEKEAPTKRVDNEERKPRTQEDMAEEAASLRQLFDQFEDVMSD